MLVLALSLLLLLPLPVIASTAPLLIMAQAQPAAPEAVLTRLFAEPVQQAWFAESFLRQVPFAGIQPLINKLTRSVGPLQEVRSRPDGFELRFERGTVRSHISLDAQGRITALYFAPPQVPLSLEAGVAAIRAFDGQASLLVLQDGVDLVSVNAEQPLAVGSAFKLAVLAALQQEINQGQRAWADVVTLQPGDKSLPSGLLQDWPDGVALTLESLATLMISLSDNTATDTLIHTLGREPIEALSPRNRPFLTTRELFVLKNPENADLLSQFRAGDAAARRTLLTTAQSAPLPSASVFDQGPLALDVEWFLTARELCDLMAQVADLSPMQVNPGVADPAAWDEIAFKGGSEPGVLNLTTQVRSSKAGPQGSSNSGHTYCVVTTWNHPEQALPEDALTQLHSGLLAGLENR